MIVVFALVVLIIFELVSQVSVILISEFRHNPYLSFRGCWWGARSRYYSSLWGDERIAQ